ncbi:CU044_5270 family protein [Streptomyces liliifuscus]|uniref:CU044_5270 family protein n=1 Tax=Streptomyces liliifuscus TaxID=2797636 RepID=A0A7T7KYE8_9ACTN|nr:CU044_5270 family protein [Streptomyces liliifuscus]QQM42649.1 CU044_5270 family protein [Streptomyces liliifuscus]
MSTIPEKDLPPGRHRVLREHLMREINGETPPEPVRRIWRRPAFVAPVVAAALSVAVVIGASVTRDAASDGPPRPHSGASERPERRSSQSPAHLLERVAVAAAKLPTGVEGDEFVYTKTDNYHWKMDPEKTVGDCDRTLEGHAWGVRERWESVDGQHVGLSREHKTGGGVVERPIAKQLPGKHSINFYEQALELPTDTEGMHRWLYGLDPGEKPSGKRSADEAAFVKASGLLTGSLLPPKTAAAFYRAVAKIPGLIVLEGARDAAGRTGVAVAMDGVSAIGFGQGGEPRSELIFDQKTLAYMGQSTVNLSAPENRCQPLEAGDLVGSVAILERAVVDKKGERP